MILIKSATIVDPQSSHHNSKKDILIENGIITSIQDSIETPENCTVVALDNLHISQGWFDSSVCFGEPGYEERETIKNGLTTAAKSGFVHVAVNPNTNPVCDTKSSVRFLKDEAKGAATNLYPIANLTKGGESKDITEMFDLKNAGAIAFSDYNTPISNANLLKIALLYAQNFDGLVFSFPIDKSISLNGIVNEEEQSTRLGLKGIPALAEELQISRDLFLLEYTGGKLHIPTISTRKSVELIREAKAKGLNVSCSVAAHNLVLTDKELQSFDSNTKVMPPLRTESDCDALIAGLKDGTIDMITSDHNPIDVEDKKLEYSRAKDGTIGLESLFGVLASELDLTTLVTALTTNAFKRFGIASESIEEGTKASLSLFNPELKYTFTEKNILSTSKNSIFLNKELTGKAYGVFSNNQLLINE